jgi:RNA polymerase sigma factor (sigma-70 family)
VEIKKLADEVLMQMLVSGNKQAFSEIYDRYATLLLNYFSRMLWHDKEKAEDFTHDLFTKIIEKPESFDTTRSFKTWFYSVANNMCKNEFKKQEIRSNPAAIIIEQSDVLKEPDISKKMDMKAFNEVLYQELDLLDENHREVFLLKYKEELSLREISEICNISEGTVKSRIFYTLKKLSDKLKIFNPHYELKEIIIK